MKVTEYKEYRLNVNNWDASVEVCKDGQINLYATLYDLTPEQLHELATKLQLIAEDLEHA